MMQRILPLSFFDRPVLEVAEDLLGKTLVRKRGAGKIAAIITEVEAYDGMNDRACHAHRGRTPRNEVMFGPAGHFYVYFIYGMHWMLNIVTGEEGYPAAVLIRGIETYEGPGKLTRALGIDRSFNGKSSHPRNGLWVEDRGLILPKRAIMRTPRIGVAYAGTSAKLPYRFVLDARNLPEL
jgi:DNA-3-methyladenine glycosylase